MSPISCSVVSLRTLHDSKGSFSEFRSADSKYPSAVSSGPGDSKEQLVSTRQATNTMKDGVIQFWKCIQNKKFILDSVAVLEFLGITLSSSADGVAICRGIIGKKKRLTVNLFTFETHLCI